MGLFPHCTCGHIDEDHAMDAPEGEQECLWRDEKDKGCSCKDWSENYDHEDEEE